MLRRKSEFFDFMDNIRTSKSESAEPDKSQLSPFEEYLQVLLDMKITSTVSSWKKSTMQSKVKGAMCKM